MRRLLIMVLTSGALMLMWPQPASACSCSQTPVEDVVAASGSIYLARPLVAPPDPGSPLDPNFDPAGHNIWVFEVERILKGQARPTIEVGTEDPRWSSCGVAITDALYVIHVSEGRDRGGFGFCNENVRGRHAVEVAQDVLGEGTEPDPSSVWGEIAVGAGISAASAAAT